MIMTIYTLPNCFRCRFMEKWATKNNYTYRVVDLETIDKETRDSWRNSGFTSAPILEIDGEYSFGSDVSFVEKKMKK